jgi:hypothetical protein
VIIMAVTPQQPQGGGGSNQPRWRRALNIVGRAVGNYFVPELVPPPVRTSVTNMGIQGGTLYIDLILGGLVGGARKNVEIYVSGFNNPFTFDLNPKFLGDVANAIADYLVKNPGIAVNIVARLTKSMGYEPTSVVSVEVRKQGDARVVSLLVSDNNGVKVEVPIILSPFNPKESKVVVGTPIVIPTRQPLKDFMRETRVRRGIARFTASSQGGVAYINGTLVIKPPGQAQPIIIQRGRASLSTVLSQVGGGTPANLVSLLEGVLRSPLSDLKENITNMLVYTGFSIPNVHEPIVIEASTAPSNDVAQFILLFPALFTNPSDQDHLENIVENRAKPPGSDAIRLGYSIYSELYKQVGHEREYGYYRREVGYDASFIPVTLTIDARNNTVMFQMPGTTPMSLVFPAQEIADALANFLTNKATETSVPGATIKVIQMPQTSLQVLGQLFQVQVSGTVPTARVRRVRGARAQRVDNITVAKFLDFGTLPTQLLIALNNAPVTLTPGVSLKYSQYLGIGKLADIDTSVVALGDAVYDAIMGRTNTQPLVNYLHGFVDALRNETSKAGVSVQDLGLIGLILKHERGAAGRSYLVMLTLPAVISQGKQGQASTLDSLIDSLSKSGNEFARALANYLRVMLKSNMVERAFRAHGLPMWKNAVLVPIAVGIRVTATQAELLTPDKVLGVLANQDFDYAKSFVDFVSQLEKKELKDWGITRSEASSRKPSAIPILTQDWVSKYAR